MFDNGLMYTGEFANDAFVEDVSPEAFAVICAGALGTGSGSSAEVANNVSILEVLFVPNRSRHTS